MPFFRFAQKHRAGVWFFFFLSCFSVLTSSEIIAGEPSPQDLPLWYWRQKTFTNFGDELSLKIVERIVKKEVMVYSRKPKNNIQKLLALGSILSFADEGDVVWGSGINGKLLSPESYRHFSHLDIRAVRGPLTRRYLIEKLRIPCPEVYGDPALLFPKLFPEFKKSKNPSHKYIIIPHYSELAQFPKSKYDNVVYPTEPWDQVIRKILDSEFVISSSMHGLIIAEAFGIPARFLKVSDTEPLFKYEDYYKGSGRQSFKPAFSIEEALLLGGEPPIRVDLDKLYRSFPFEFFNDSKNPAPGAALSFHPDLEKDFPADFILSTQKIEVPGFFDAFNPSIIKWNGTNLMSFRTGSSHLASESDETNFTTNLSITGSNALSFLMSFRVRDTENRSYTNEIGLIFLDSNFNPIGKPQLIHIDYSDPTVATRQQDPRLITIDGHLFMVYSNFIENLPKKEIRRMFVVELIFDGQHFSATKPVCLINFEGESEQRWQKNWVPLEYQKQLLLAYSINPHLIFQPNLQTGNCETVSKSQAKISWDWGTLRGGTPAILDNGEYLAFFHSSKDMKTVHSDGKKIQHYFMGAYTFSPAPPFALSKISPHPIVGDNFYHGPAHQTWKPVRVVFPGGFLVDDQHVWVFYGRQDHEIWVTKLDKNKLYDSLIPVK